MLRGGARREEKLLSVRVAARTASLTQTALKVMMKLANWL